MFFTQDDYKKIQQWLTKNSVKDTEFNEASIPFNGEEIITIVQGNQNKKVFLKDLVAQVFNLGISDFVNITDKYDAPNISLEEAIRLIPSRARKEGQVITFLDKEDHWHIYQFKGTLNQWNVLDTWEDLFDWEKLIINSILPDEEDLTKSLPDVNGNSYLSLKDREYNPNDFSGLGRVILRKNIVEVEDPIYGKVKKNVLYQDMINKENTIYEIRYDFDLNNQTITIPNNSVIKFIGGSIHNGKIICDNTSFLGDNLINVILQNVQVSGTLANYGFSFKLESDISDILLNLLDVFSYVKIGPGNYNISKPIIINNTGTTLEGSGKHATKLNYIGEETEAMIYMKKSNSEKLHYAISFNTIKNLTISSGKLANIGIDNQGPSCTFENLYIVGFKDFGIQTNNSWCTHINNCIITYCNIGIYLNGNSHNTSIFECRIESNYIYDILIISCAGVNITNCVLESECKTSIYVAACRDLNILNNYFEGSRLVKGSQIDVSYVPNAYDDTININTLIFIGNSPWNWRDGKYFKFDAVYDSYNVNINNNHVEGATGYLACATSCRGLNIKNNNIQGDKTVFLLPYVYNTTIYNLEIYGNISTTESEQNIAKPIDFLYSTNNYFIINDNSIQHIYGKCKLDGNPETFLENINNWNRVRTNYTTPYKIDKFNLTNFEVLLSPSELSEYTRYFGTRQIFPGKGLYCIELTTKLENLVDDTDIVTYEFLLKTLENLHIASKIINPTLKIGEKTTTKFYIYIDNIHFGGFSIIFKSTKSKNTYRFINPKVYRVGSYIPNTNYYLEASMPFQNTNDLDLYTKGINIGTISKYENTSKVCISTTNDFTKYDKWTEVKNGLNVNLLESNTFNWLNAITENNTAVKVTPLILASIIKPYLLGA